MRTLLRLTWEKVRALLLGNRLDREFEDELASHIELAIEDGERRGLDPEQARREALRRLGRHSGHQRVPSRHARSATRWTHSCRTLPYGVRTLQRTPVFTLVVVASLALGIGANTAVFTIINAVLLRTLPVPHPDELVRLTARPVLSFAMYQDLRRRQQVFTDILATTREWQVRLTITGPTGTSTLDNLPTSFVSSNYFDVLLLRPQIGRFFVDEDDGHPQGAEAEGSVAVISDGLWERQFARDPAVIGRIIHVNRSACRVIGVAPRGYVGDSVGVVVDLWVPVIPFSPRNYLEGRGGQFTQSIARLKPGVTLTQARGGDDDALQGNAPGRVEHISRDPPANDPRGFCDKCRTVSTGLDSGLRWKFSTPLWIIMAIVAAVLLIACANVANLLLARSAWRRGEFSLRLALGCGRGGWSDSC